LDSIRNIILGLLLTSLIALLSFYFSSFIPIGSVAIAILIGISVNNTFLNQTEFFKTGISFSEKQLLSSAIILLGASLNFNKVMLIPISSVIFIVCIISISLLLCYLLGKIFGLNKNLSVLLGIGNGVCGSSAIAGASKILDADKNDVGVSIAIINVLGAISIFILPYILMNFFPHFTNEQSGFLIGSTVQAVGQVTATGFIINQEVGEYATFIKMIRIIMLGPILLCLSFFIKNRSKNNQAGIFNIPYFITGFVIISLLVTFNFIPENFLLRIHQLSKILLVIAMAGIGLNISFRNIFEFGFKPFAIAALAFSFQIVFTFVIVILCF